jgi:negative regulator of flagellin synthesis FlgM
MKIEGNLHFIDQNYRVQKEKASPDHQQARVSKTGGVEDRLEFSTSIREFQQLEKKAQEVPEIRAERVADIKRELNSGTYNIKAEKVADAMIRGAIVSKRA